MSLDEDAATESYATDTNSSDVIPNGGSDLDSDLEDFYRYFDTPSCTFQIFHHIFISYTYRTMKSLFFQFREKVEGGVSKYV